MDNSTLGKDKLKQAVNLADKMLAETTGLGEFERRVTAYYITSTYFQDNFNPMPIFVIKGPTGTGKTTVLRLCNLLCFRPVMFSGGKITSPALRDKLKEAYMGTAIIDEADNPAADFEQIINNRYLKETAFAFKKGDPDPDTREWDTLKIPIFGATILHKRVPFEDPSVESRSIIIQTRPVTGTAFKNVGEIEPMTKSYVDLMNESLSIKLNKFIKKPKSVSPRVLDSYLPIIVLAKNIDDVEFMNRLLKHIEIETAGFIDGQSYEPGALLLEAIIHFSGVEGRLVYKKGVKIEGGLINWILDTHGKRLNAFQASKILRGYELTVKRVDGVNQVYIDDVRHFIGVCISVGIDDETVNKEAMRLNMELKK
jgi:hypothetical protein